MKKLLILLLLLPVFCFSQIDLKQTFKFATFYGAVNGGTSVSDVDVYSVTNGLTTTTVETPFDYSISLGLRKIARFGYENKANKFYDGTENSFSDAATIGKVKGFEYLFETDIKRQEYYESSQRYRYKLGNKLSFNIGAVQRVSEPYGYDPLEEWVLSNGNLHYTYLALQEGYNVDVFNQVYTDPNGDVVATNTEVWEAVIIPEVLANYTEKKKSELPVQWNNGLVLGFDFYHYTKNLWVHSWGNLIPCHYDDGGEYSYHNFNDGKQWNDYSGGLIFGYKLNKQLGCFIEGRYNKYWNREWHDFKFGINYVIF